MVLHTNVKLMGELVQHFCFRPSVPSSLIADRIEDMEDTLPQISAMLGGGVVSWPGLQLVVIRTSNAASICFDLSSAFCL